MNKQKQFSSISEAITLATGVPFELAEKSSLSGGCINRASRIRSFDNRDFFVKENEIGFLPFFEAEAKALEEIEGTSTLQVPRVISFGSLPDGSFLILSFVTEGSSTKLGESRLGEALADLHKIRQPHFGWKIDNCIGSTPQPNPKSEDWIEFFRSHRLEHQFKLARKKGKEFTNSDQLLSELDCFFPDYSPQPSLLHGDLWGGNTSYDSRGMPFVFDPASYYGDREADLAFTYMFGGFSKSFYESYQSVFPLDSGFQIRKTLYNLYHELNHFNLFGGGYAYSAQSSIDQLLSSIS